MALGRIDKVDLREQWPHEAVDFTQWLAMPENLELLSDEIDIELSLIDTEYNVGRFNVDIFAEDLSADRKVIIENQLERTDHDHLGKLITYASGLEAEIVIWIVKEVLEEHQQAIDWLNENTIEKINFFAIKMELWRIGDSESAPRFHVISSPNNWAKSVKQSVQKSAFTDTKLLQLKFWDSFKQHALENNLKLRLRKTCPQHWYDMSFGRADSHISLTVHSQKKEISCEIYIPNSMETYESFLSNKEAIDAEISDLDWQALPTKKASRIKKVLNGDFTNESKWDEFFNWLGNTAIAFQETFNRY